MVAERVAPRAARAKAAPVPEAAVWAALAEVPDPEIPAISVVDLGVVHRVATAPGSIEVEILPTFVGCPAIEMMRSAIAARLDGMADRVDVGVTFSTSWTTDRISPHGRRRLRASGFGPPVALDAVHCPYCDSADVAFDSAFGPTLCRALYYCRSCRQPFEQFKPV